MEFLCKARRKNGQTHGFNKADVFLFDVMVLGVRVKYTQRMLVGGDVATQYEIGLIVGINTAYNRGYRIMRRSVRRVSDDSNRRIRICSPRCNSMIGRIEKSFFVGRSKPYYGKRPREDFSFYIRIFGEAKGF